MGPFDGRIVLITGAAGGIGAETARILAGLGADLALCDLNGCDALAEELRGIGTGVTMAAFDIRDRAQAEAFIAAQPRLDVIVANAGFCPWDDWTDADWDDTFERVVDINLKGVINVMRPAIARMIMRSDAPALGLVDGDQHHAGEWFSEQTLPPAVPRGRVVALSWDEAYNVFGGRMHRASYVNVPSGQYTFRAIGVAGDDRVTGDQLSLTIVIPPPFWKRFWFWPLVSAGAVTVLASVIFAFYRSRAKRAVERLRFQNTLEKDRIRIARDMHDDLGSRLTFINMSAAMARRELETSPDNARRHLARVTASARELVGAMDDLVWAVDPAHDSLDDLASHIARLADDMFRDSSVRCRLEIPSDLPPLPLGSDFRHHIALAVKEAMHNVLRHAGPCEAFVSLEFDGSMLRVTVRDTGVGLAVDAADRSRHGLDNLVGRLREIGGACEIESSAGVGTCVVLRCPVARESL